MTTKANSRLTDANIKEKLNPDESFSFAALGSKFAEFLTVHKMPFNDKGEYLWLGANLDYSRFAFFRGNNRNDEDGNYSSFGQFTKSGDLWSIDKLTTTFGIAKQAVIGGIETRAKLGINVGTFVADEKDPTSGEWYMTGEEIVIYLVTKHSKVGAPAANICVVELIDGMTIFDISRMLHQMSDNDSATLGNKKYRVYSRKEWADTTKARKKAKADKRAAKNAQGANVQ